MGTQLNPYLSFRDNAREAMEFYQSVFGGKLEITTFKDLQASQDPSEDDKVMHSTLTTDSGLVFMAADTPNGMEYSEGSRITMSLSGEDEHTLRDYFERLKAGGMETMPLEKAPWGDAFGMLRDRYGIAWMVNISAAQSGEVAA